MTPSAAGNPHARRLLRPGAIVAEIALFILLIAAGATVRLIYLGDLPAGLNTDEASAGYEAWAILEHGIDRNGYHNPVHLVSWGSGQNALYSYLSMPFIKLLGLTELSIRLAQALLGVASLLVMYAVGRMLAGRIFALFALFALVISPWHIMMSRWALESNLLPGIVLLAFAFLIRGIKSPRWVIPAFFLLAISLYAYGTAYLFVPLFALGVLAYGMRRRVVDLKHWGIGLVVMVVTAIPIGLFVLINLLDWQPIETPLFSLPKYPVVGRFVELPAFFSTDFFGELQMNITGMFNIFISGNGGLRYNAIPEFGFYYRWGFFLSLLGIGIIVYDIVKGRSSSGNALALVILWLAIAVLSSIMLPPNINRANLVWLPLVICAAYGLYRLWGLAVSGGGGNILSAVSRRALPGIVCAALVVYLAVSFVAFTGAYFGDWSERRLYLFAPSYPEALRHILRHTDENETVYLTPDEEYTYALFYAKPPPQAYLDTVDLVNREASFQKVSSFGRYVFGFNEKAMSEGSAFLADNDELYRFPLSRFSVVRFDFYSAVYRRARPVDYESVVSGGFGAPAARDAFEVYRRGTTVAYIKESCDGADTEAPFFLHIFPADADDLPRHRRGYEFDAFSFDFSEQGVFADGKCLALAALPGYEIDRIRTGQWVRGDEKVWQAEFSVGE